MRVDTSLLQGIAAANQSAQSKSSSLKSTGTTASFSSALKSASEETTKPVDGQNYAEILTGPRAGMYLNTGGGARDGEAFVLVKHGGVEDHIYGTGSDRKVVRVGGSKSEDSSSSSAEKTSSTDKSSSSAEKAPAGEKTKQVEGRAYADILNGKRSGLYLNTSGNVRDGQTFALVNRNGREFHIYGTGADRTIVSVKAKPDADVGSTTSTDTSKPDKTDKTDTPTTGTTTTGAPVTDNPTSSH